MLDDFHNLRIFADVDFRVQLFQPCVYFSEGLQFLLPLAALLVVVGHKLGFILILIQHLQAILVVFRVLPASLQLQHALLKVVYFGVKVLDLFRGLEIDLVYFGELGWLGREGDFLSGELRLLLRGYAFVVIAEMGGVDAFCKRLLHYYS
jgi:hypothetical protein